MTFTVKVLLTIALILSIAVPFGAFAAGERSRGRYKRALAANVFLFFGTMVFASCLFFTGNAFAAETASAASNATAWAILRLPFPPVFPVSAAALPCRPQPPLPWEPSVRIPLSLVNP